MSLMERYYMPLLERTGEYPRRMVSVIVDHDLLHDFVDGEATYAAMVRIRDEVEAKLKAMGLKEVSHYGVCIGGYWKGPLHALKVHGVGAVGTVVYG